LIGLTRVAVLEMTKLGIVTVLLDDTVVVLLDEAEAPVLEWEPDTAETDGE
jgi:hypothetical protein